VAVYNEILAGRFNRFVQKYLSMKGPTSLVAASPDLRFVHPFFNGTENRYLEGWDLFGLTDAPAAAGVGNLTHFRLRNPAASGIIAVVVRVQLIETTSTLSLSASSTLQISRSITTDQNAIVTPVGWDNRGRPGPTCVFSANTGAPAAFTGGQSICSGTAAAFTAFEFLGGREYEIPLLPGAGLEVLAGTANDACICTFWWRERPLEDSEKF